MRVLVLSDIHANLEALEACLETAPDCDVAVNLGDVIGYGASPNEVIDRVRQLCRLHVRGNHDKACATLTSVEGFNPIAALAAYWTRQSLTADNLRWLQELPPGPRTLDGLERVQFVHGSALDEDEYVIGVTDAVQPLLRTQASLTLFGHSHLQGGFSLYREQASEIHPQIDPGAAGDSSVLQLNARARYLINPGSVGQPRDGDWRAGFMVYDSDAAQVTFYRVPYDLKRAQARIIEAQLPERLATRLAFGR